MEEKLTIFSVDICKEPKQSILNTIESILESESQNKIFTPNTEMLLAAAKNESIADMLNSARLLIPDGTGVMLASRILGSPISERASGIDIGYEILNLAAKTRRSVFLLGGKEGVAQRAAEKLKSALPSLNVCGAHHGYFEKSGVENAAVIDEIRRAAPDILFVCFGFPTQERWICENLTALPSVRVAMGLGGSLDVWAGDKKRAPNIIQKLGFEWLWRALPEPKRLKILLAIPEFLYRSTKEKKRAEL